MVDGRKKARKPRVDLSFGNFASLMIRPNEISFIYPTKEHLYRDEPDANK